MEKLKAVIGDQGQNQVSLSKGGRKMNKQFFFL